MKINLRLMLVVHNSQEEREVPEGMSVQGFLDDYLPACPRKIHRMLVDKEGIFRGVILLNKTRPDFNQILKDGDELILLSVISGG